MRPEVVQGTASFEISIFTVGSCTVEKGSSENAAEDSSRRALLTELRLPAVGNDATIFVWADEGSLTDKAFALQMRECGQASLEKAELGIGLAA